MVEGRSQQRSGYILVETTVGQGSLLMFTFPPVKISRKLPLPR